MTYDSNLHFCDFTKGFKVVVSNENPFPYSTIFNVHEKRDSIIDFLTNFTSLWENNTNTGSNFYSAIETAISILKPYGGRLMIIQ